MCTSMSIPQLALRAPWLTLSILSPTQKALRLALRPLRLATKLLLAFSTWFAHKAIDPIGWP